MAQSSAPMIVSNPTINVWRVPTFVPTFLLLCYLLIKSGLSPMIINDRLQCTARILSSSVDG